MRVDCPYCGNRELSEFSFQGDAAPKRPAGDASNDVFYDYVYLRDNPAGDLVEHWYHGGGCRAWLRVTRNTVTHAVVSVESAKGAGAQPSVPA